MDTRDPKRFDIFNISDDERSDAPEKWISAKRRRLTRTAPQNWQQPKKRGGTSQGVHERLQKTLSLRRQTCSTHADTPPDTDSPHHPSPDSESGKSQPDTSPSRNETDRANEADEDQKDTREEMEDEDDSDDKANELTDLRRKFKDLRPFRSCREHNFVSQGHWEDHLTRYHSQEQDTKDEGVLNNYDDARFLAKLAITNLSKHQTLSRKGLNSYFGKKKNITLDEVIECLKDAGHRVIEDSEECQTMQQKSRQKVYVLQKREKDPYWLDYQPNTPPEVDDDSDSSESTKNTGDNSEDLGEKDSDYDPEEEIEAVSEPAPINYKQDSTKAKTQEKGLYKMFPIDRGIWLKWFTSMERKIKSKGKKTSAKLKPGNVISIRYAAQFCRYAQSGHNPKAGLQNVGNFDLYKTLEMAVSNNSFSTWMDELETCNAHETTLEGRCKAVKHFLDFAVPRAKYSHKIYKEVESLASRLRAIVSFEQRNIYSRATARRATAQPDMRSIEEILRAFNYTKMPKYAEFLKEVEKLETSCALDDPMFKGPIPYNTILTQKYKTFRYIYRMTVGTLLAYVCSNNGQRSDVLMNLQVGEYERSLKDDRNVDGYRIIEVRVHKTQQNRLATIALDPQQAYVLDFYVKWLRPVVARPLENVGDHDWLILNFAGNPYNGQQSVTWAFYRGELGLVDHTLRDLRKFMATLAHSNLTDSPTDFADIAMYMNHSLATVNKYYKQNVVTFTLRGRELLQNVLDRAAEEPSRVVTIVDDRDEADPADDVLLPNESDDDAPEQRAQHQAALLQETERRAAVSQAQQQQAEEAGKQTKMKFNWAEELFEKEHGFSHKLPRPKAHVIKQYMFKGHEADYKRIYSHILRRRQNNFIEDIVPALGEDGSAKNIIDQCNKHAFFTSLDSLLTGDQTQFEYVASASLKDRIIRSIQSRWKRGGCTEDIEASLEDEAEVESEEKAGFGLEQEKLQVEYAEDPENVDDERFDEDEISRAMKESVNPMADLATKAAQYRASALPSRQGGECSTSGGIVEASTSEAGTPLETEQKTLREQEIFRLQARLSTDGFAATLGEQVSSQNWPYVKVVDDVLLPVHNISIGKGLFAAENIPKDTVVANYHYKHGNLVSFRQLASMEKNYARDRLDFSKVLNYAQQMHVDGKTHIILAHDFSEQDVAYGHLVNSVPPKKHSKCCNLKAIYEKVPVQVETGGISSVEEQHHMFFVTTKEVSKGQQLLHDYGLMYQWGQPGTKVKVFCPKCGLGVNHTVQFFG